MADRARKLRVLPPFQSQATMTTATASTIRKKPALMATMVGAIGVVFGDIGTSPLYTLKECLHAAGHATATQADLYGVECDGEQWYIKLFIDIDIRPPHDSILKVISFHPERFTNPAMTKRRKLVLS